jgi:hypothetical protein
MKLTTMALATAFALSGTFALVAEPVERVAVRQAAQLACQAELPAPAQAPITR